MSAIIKCDNVSIRYITGDFKDIGLKEYLVRRLTKQYSVIEFWADRHVTFELQPGDMLGIIGSNGAGKSTLLKAISGIMVPTEGSVECHGKIAALLELASGFDGDLTVRENTYLRAAMLGYSRDFVDRTYDAIIDFAELRGFEDRPFKQLSSGMKSRLAFSIASLVDPEILILDEVLSVGDGAFRKKSEAKMRQIIGGGATTILVSHSVGQVRSLCNKVLWLDHGTQIAFGNNVAGLCDAYQAYLDTRKLPAPDELPPCNVAVAVVEKPAAQQTSTVSDGSGTAVSTGAVEASAPVGDGAPAPDNRSRALRRPPKAVVVTAAAVLLLTAAIAVSEATLPSRVQALPADDANVLFSDEATGAQVCLWDNKLYVFVDRAQAEGATFWVSAVDSHGRVTQRSFSIAHEANRRYSSNDTVVLEVNMARFPGYVEATFGMVETSAPGADGVPELVWEATYVKGENAIRRF